MLRRLSSSSTASRSVLEGTVPVWMDTPPTRSRRSITATERPSLAAWMAAFCPLGPDPMTIRSKSRSSTPTIYPSGSSRRAARRPQATRRPPSASARDGRPHERVAARSCSPRRRRRTRPPRRVPNRVPNSANLIPSNRTQPNEKTPKQAQKPCKPRPSKPAGPGSPRVGRFDSFAAPWLYTDIRSRSSNRDFGDMRLEDVTPEAIERWKPTLSVSNRTVHKYLVVMHGIFKRAMKVSGLPRNPMTAVDRPRIRVSDDLHAFSPGDPPAGPRRHVRAGRAVFLTAAFTGLRMGELLALQWGDVDFGGQSIRVRRSYNAHGGRSSPKSGKVRSVPMVPDVASALAALGTRELLTGDEDLVFPGDFGEYMDGSALRDRYKRTRARGTSRASFARSAPHVRDSRRPSRRGPRRPGVDGSLGNPDDHALRPLPGPWPRG